MSAYWRALGYGGAMVGGRTLTVDGRDLPDKWMPGRGGAAGGRCARCRQPWHLLYELHGGGGRPVGVQLQPGWVCTLCRPGVTA